jgi:anti-anti-sigma regulatory factor
MPAWRSVSLVGATGTLRAPGQLADELKGATEPVLFTGALFGRVAPHARLLCRHLASIGRPWAVESDVSVARQPALLQLARRSGCRAVLIGPDPDLLARAGGADRSFETAADLRRIRHTGLLTVVRLALGRDGDDAGVFARAVRLCTAGRVAFPQLIAHEGATAMSAAELERGLAWARRSLHTHRAIWRRTGLLGSPRRAALLVNYRTRRELRAEPPPEPTSAMRLARALARPIRIRERVAFVSTLVGAVQASGEQVRHAWLRARAMRDETVAALVIRLEGTVDAHAARKLVARVRRAIGRTPERIVVDLGGVELVSLSVLTRFLEEHAGRLGELQGRLAFRNLRPALAAVRRNLHGMLPNAALLEHALEEAS